MKSPFDIKNKKQVIEFEEVDSFNPQNILKGYVNRRQGHLYGSLWITHVNGKKCPQLIYSAPKQHYPFDKDNKWEFPECDFIELYEKIDGTCIISYHYRNVDGYIFTTYKTRLRPFLGSSKFGNFFALWNEMLEKYPQIDDTCKNISFNFVFELYGKRNRILIEYDVPLDTILIFIIDRLNGIIYPPNEFDLDFDIPILECKGMLTDWHDYNINGKKDRYLKIQEELELGLKVDEENHILKGEEGHVWYFMKDGCAVQIKNKPPSVLKYHWSGDAIAYESVYTTVINAFENFDEPTYADVIGLLQEEFDDSKIEKSRVRIEKTLGKALFDRKFQFQLADDYRKHGFDINKDKVACMQFFGKNYPKSEAHRIFNLLKRYEEEI